MADKAEDVNTETDSSKVSADVGGQQHDVTKDSSALSTQTDGDTDKSLQDFVKENLVIDQKEPDAEAPEKESDSENELDEKDKDSKVEDKEEESKEKDPKAEDDKEEELQPDKPVPYDRFKEVNEDRNTLRERLKNYEEHELKYYNNINNFCQENQISVEQHENALKILALQNTNPEEAIKLLENELQAMKGFVGDKLPEDLQLEVDNGEIKLERAKEIAKLRAQGTVAEKRRENTAKLQSQRTEAQMQSEMRRMGKEWVEQKVKTDPDFFQKKKESDPDGKFETVMDKYIAMLHMERIENGKRALVHPVNSPADMAKLLEKAYESVNHLFTTASNRGRKPTKEPLRSNKESSSHKQSVTEAKTMREAVMIGMRERGHSVG